MGYINTDQCDCCKEVWNRINLHHIPLQSKTLIMCDDCLSEFNHCFVNVHKINKTIEEIEQYGAEEQECGDQKIANAILNILEILKNTKEQL